MIEDLLRVSCLEESADTVHPELFSFSELLDPIVLAYTRRAELQGVSLLPPRALECKIWADRSMLRRVIENILDNSLRYTPASGRVSISASSQDGFELLVANDGPSIAPAPPHISRIQAMARAAASGGAPEGPYS